MSAAHRRVVVLGLDSVPPGLLFDRFLPRLPRIRELMERGQWGTLRTVDPPITVPAWAVMFTGVDPGTLGIYGFRHRRRGTYFDTYTPTPQMIPVAPLWEILSRRGRRVAVMGMPPGYPPPVVNGVYLGDFHTPADARDPVYPASMAGEIQAAADGAYRFDVSFRAEDRDRIATELLEMTRRRWAVARHLWSKEPWDLFAVHDIGPDRLHHTFWKYLDPAHPQHVEHPVYTPLADRVYSLLNDELGRFLDLVGDDVSILVASDHGSQAMDGCFCINDWLAERGYLVFRGPRPKPGTDLEDADVDWSRTRVWGAGGYYARLFFNVRGREPEGILDPGELPALQRRLGEEMSEVRREDGRPLAPRLLAPREIYREVRGDAPDLMVYFGNLQCRSAGTLGYDRLFLPENDTGPDDSVHSFEGVYLWTGGPSARRGAGVERQILDVAPTLLRAFGEPVPERMQGTPIVDWL